jgi:RIO kinase 1
MNLRSYEDNEEFIPYLVPDRRTHRAEKRPRELHAPQRPPAAMAEAAALLIDENEMTMTFGAGASEEALLQAALSGFYRDHVITDVLARVKGGKEANVYCCQAHPGTGLDLIAAKIYRPQAHRTMRNDAIYKEGRLILDDEGKGIVRGARIKRAIAKKTEFGREVMTFSWIEHEYDMLQLLHAAGADVPRPMGHVSNAILMEYLGDINDPAPNLNSVVLSQRAARVMFKRLLWHVELMLKHNRIHSDLSAYNILYWEGKAVVIDFPQAVVALKNPHAFDLLQRDIARLCQYFARYDIQADALALATGLWQDFMEARL